MTKFVLSTIFVIVLHIHLEYLLSYLLQQSRTKKTCTGTVVCMRGKAVFENCDMHLSMLARREGCVWELWYAPISVTQDGKAVFDNCDMHFSLISVTRMEGCVWLLWYTLINVNWEGGLCLTTVICTYQCYPGGKAVFDYCDIHLSIC